MLKTMLRAVLVCGLAAAAQAAPFVIYDTGVDNNGDALTPTTGYPAGQVADPHYTITTAPAGFSTPFSATTVPEGYPIKSSPADTSRPWAADDPNPGGARWISQMQYDTDGVGGNPAGFTGNSPAGNYTFTTTFDLTGYEENTATISGQWAADNLADMYLNGVLVNSLALNTFGTLTSFTSPNTANFVSGVNTLSFVVNNTVTSPMGLLVANITGDAVQVPELNAANAALPLGMLFFALAAGVDRRRRNAVLNV